MSLPPLPWKPCRAHEDVDGPMWPEDDPEMRKALDARPFVKIVASDGQTVVTAHDLFEFKPGVAEAICAAFAALRELHDAVVVNRQMPISKDKIRRLDAAQNAAQAILVEVRP